MISEKQVGITDEFGITEQRGMYLYSRVQELNEKENSLADILKILIKDMDLSTEELVVASFFLGKTQTMEFKIMQSMLNDMMNGK